MRNHLVTALMFGLFAGAVRTMLPDVKTRLQIAVLLSLAASFELLLRVVQRQPPSLSRFSMHVLAILIAATTAKIAIDGWPHFPPWVCQIAISLGIPL